MGNLYYFVYIQIICTITLKMAPKIMIFKNIVIEKFAGFFSP